MQYRRLRAPANHGQQLIDPPLTTVASLVAGNRSTAPASTDMVGQSFRAFGTLARRDLLAAARDYTAAYRDVSAHAMDPDAPLVMAGHQPTLFHPGVWFKNFVLDRVARQLQGVAVNLLVDNDVSAQEAIRVPTGSAAAPRTMTVAYDRAQPGIPFEECRVRDAELFASFGGRARDVVRSFSPDPLVTQFWPLVQQAALRTDRTHQCLAEARHRIEGDWGLTTLEVPLSAVCQQAAFRQFMAHVLAHAERFQAEHNAALAEYRRVNRVRSKTHPVPELTRQDDWFETPFWVWTNTDQLRRPLFARTAAGGYELADLRGLVMNHAPLLPERNAVEFFAEQEQRGIKIRPRALMTTMFCRHFLSDLFIHGIGGAKYDQLTDDLIRRFWGHSAPSFLVVTATAQLPIARDPVTIEDLRELRLRLRDFRFHPEHHVDVTPATKPLIEEKQTWIHDATSNRGERHQAITRLNRALGGFLGKMPMQVEQRAADVVAALGRERILASREYSFCLFSTATLQPLLLDI